MIIKTYDQLFDAEDKEANHDGIKTVPVLWVCYEFNSER